jgi:uncharacterized DUF497 family protein
MEFAWDENQALANLSKLGVSFQPVGAAVCAHPAANHAFICTEFRSSEKVGN